MLDRLRGRWLNLRQNLAFIPGCIVVVFGVLGVGLVELDRHVDLGGAQEIFAGDGPAARTLLSVIAGSLITVAGLTFSITMVVLQLASSQFSPRVLRTFFGDRITQVTIGFYVGTFVYAILVLRAVGSFADSAFVPRLSVTVASLFGIAAVVLLIVFLNHVAQMVQVSHVIANIARDTLNRTDALYATEEHGTAVTGRDADGLLDTWRLDLSGRVMPARPGYVQRVGLESLIRHAAGHADRLAILVCPGDFVGVDTPLVQTWPAEAADACGFGVAAAVTITDERDLDQDVDFGVRQLADIALKAMSPGINDPATAVTAIGYLRAILVRLTELDDRPGVRQVDDGALTVVIRHRGYAEYLESSIVQIGRYVDGDAWVTTELLNALGGCAAVARRRGATARLAAIDTAARAIAEEAIAEAGSAHDRARITRALDAALMTAE